MSQWIDWMFNTERKTPAVVKNEGHVYLEGDNVIYAARKGYRNTVVDLTRLQYVYIYTTENCQNLVLNDYNQHFIPCSVDGFETIFRYLSGRFILDEKKFLEVLASKKPQKAELWRAKSPDNCQILNLPGDSEQMDKGPSEGFWICSTPRQWISWDMTSQELAGLPQVYQTTSEYGLTEIRFHFPVQIGNMVLDDLRCPLPGHLRMDVPLDDLYSNIRIQGNGDQNYLLAKSALDELLDEAATVYQRDDQNSCQWVANGIRFALIYWYDSQFSYQSGHAYFNLKNQRTYPGYLTDPAYELNIELTQSLFLERSFSIGSDFRRSRYFQSTPRKVTSQLHSQSAQFMIWVDAVNGKVGFANAENAMIFPIEILSGFQCQNVVPDRSSGGAYLSANLKQGELQCILIGDCHSFDGYIDQLKEMVQLPVEELIAYE